MNEVYLVFGRTESGDDWHLVFKSLPTNGWIIEKSFVIEDGTDT